MLFRRYLGIHSFMLSATIAAGFLGCSDDSSSSNGATGTEGTEIEAPASSSGTEVPPVSKAEEPEDTTATLKEDVPTPDGGYAGVLMGVCEKGPFLAGGTVKLSFLSDDDLSATGKSVDATITDDKGSYTIQYSGMESLGLLEATGKFLNEVSGEKGSAPITLRALVRAIDGDSANINVLTHLEYPRIIYLMKEKSLSYADAQSQAEREVLKALYMKNFKVPAQNTSVLGSSEADANLLAASLLLTAENSSADMQAFLDAVATDIEKDGTWDDEQTKATIADWAYMQRMDDLTILLEDIGPIPNFAHKFRTFWYEAFGLGTCDSTLYDQLKPNTNSLSKYAGKDFSCTDSTWRIASASAIQNREGTELFGECTEAMEGTLKEANSRTYICKKTKWNYATEADLLNNAVAAKNGACTATNNGNVVQYETDYVMCINSAWKKLDVVPVDYSKGRAMNKKLGQGINLGNAWESQGQKGSSGDCGWNNCIKDEYFKVIKDAGFKSVRLPVRWNYDAAKDAPYTLDAGRLAGVKADIELALAQGLVVIVNFHHYVELNNYALYYDNTPSGYEKEKARFLGMWEQVAREMDEYGDDQIVLEIFNEPHEMKNKFVDDLMLSAYEVIRKNAPGKTIMFEGNGYSKFAQISNVKLPADGNIIFTGHYYEPFEFTHQGHGYDCGRHLRDTDISKVPIQFKAYVDSALVHFPDINGGHIPMNMGEFGVSTCSGDGPTSEERAKWTDAAIKAAESYGMSWHYWGLTGVGGFEAYTGSWNTNLFDVFKKYL